jgi:hypothetical protein
MDALSLGSTYIFGKLKVYVRSSIHSLKHYQSRYDGCKAYRLLQWTLLIYTVNVVKRKYTVIIKYDHSQHNHRLFFTLFYNMYFQYYYQ